MRAYLRSCLCVIGFLVVTGCAPQVESDGSTTDVPPTAERVFAEMEERLLRAPTLHLRYTAISEGAFSASLSGTVNIAQPDGFDLDATGTFGDSPVEAFLRSSGDGLEGESNEREIRTELPPALHEAVLIGLTRMGVLHNLARLTTGAIPDHASGGVQDWVMVEEVRFDPDADGPRPDLTAIRFSIIVSGQRTAEATVWVDPATGLPVHRVQVVNFPSGQMRVTESYEFLTGAM